MAKAIWNGTVLAESSQTIVVEGNHYFPPDSVKWDYFEKTNKTSICPWKGEAGYFNVEVIGTLNRNGAWYYPNPKEAANQIKGYVAFWNGIQVQA
jgi:uncharacterized protein (DUF427 family)